MPSADAVGELFAGVAERFVDRMRRETVPPLSVQNFMNFQNLRKIDMLPLTTLIR